LTDLHERASGAVPSASPGVPTTAEELAKLEASYRPFQAVGSWRRLHVDEPRWTRYSRVLARQIREAGTEAWADVQDRLIRAATLESTALDGLFPANPELTSAVLGTSIRGPGSDDEMAQTIELLAECHRRALVLASEAAVDGRLIDANFIAVLQDVITESQATYTVTTEEGVNVEVDLPRRQYKPVSNYLILPEGLAVFAPASRVAAEMTRLEAELSSDDFAALHPIIQAAYAHYALTAIHPFADGNGRLARTIASIFLVRSTGVPFLIFADQWPNYYQALKDVTQDQDVQSLVDYLAGISFTAMDFATSLLAGRPANGLVGSRPPSRARSRRKTPRAALDEGGRRLLEAVSVELREVLVSPPRGIRLAVAQTWTMPTGHAESAYRIVSDETTGRVGVSVALRAERRGASGADPASVDLEFVALASEVPHDLLPLALRETHSKALLEVPLSDAYPLVLEPTVLRIRLWVQRLLGEALESTASAAADRPRPRRQLGKPEGPRPR